MPLVSIYKLFDSCKSREFHVQHSVQLLAYMHRLVVVLYACYAKEFSV